jgi:hypothetical protein
VSTEDSNVARSVECARHAVGLPVPVVLVMMDVSEDLSHSTAEACMINIIQSFSFIPEINCFRTLVVREYYFVYVFGSRAQNLLVSFSFIVYSYEEGFYMIEQLLLLLARD